MAIQKGRLDFQRLQKGMLIKPSKGDTSVASGGEVIVDSKEPGGFQS